MAGPANTVQPDNEKRDECARAKEMYKNCLLSAKNRSVIKY